MSLQADLEAEVHRVWAGQTDGAHDIWHVRRVWATCGMIADQMAYPVNRDVLMIAAYLHDIINLPKDDPQRAQAASLSADHAVAWMQARGIAGQEQVHHCISAHSFSAGVPCETAEARILQDADRLEALGAIGIARCFSVSGQMGRGLVHGGDPLADARALDDGAYALDHFEVKLYRIAETLHTEPARAIAAERVAFMRAFVAQMVGELRVGSDPNPSDPFPSDGAG
ncbi:HD domain-containing protein [uncultured Tateyamaria sp.]|uniref:HD domain-containing protein n=1 Tax=uncultured Tateyamaria sp. TaxID=455651 RepID=UPI00262D1CB0|nr:HD domain-containing protein [uncultured Tateyamaria sp.]